jgi:UDP-N-acetylglucosamine 2-epimerase (non-hydrolysing)
MFLIDLIVGARPNFVKIAPIIDALRQAQDNGNDLCFRLIHTGQHYDSRLSDSFFSQLNIPDPDFNLGAGSGTQAELTAAIMIGYEKILMSERSDLCLVVGDVTSTMACAITAKKLATPVAHIEAGIRSGDWNMPEEVNRIVTDALSDWYFTTSVTANENLLRSGVDAKRIFFVGNTMIDTLYKYLTHLKPPSVWFSEALQPGNYLVLTLHRPSNVDNDQKLIYLLETISESASGVKIVFPVHPRIANQIKNFKKLINLIPIEPLGYFEFNYLVKYSKGVITDSGGVTEETTVLGIPCITLRENTERPETVIIGTNELVGSDASKIRDAIKRMINGQWKKGMIPELWDGQAATRIVESIERLVVPHDSSDN